MKAMVYPTHGLAPFELNFGTNDVPSCSEKIPGGYDQATLPALPPKKVQHAMIGSQVQLIGPRRPVWHGIVTSWDATGLQAHGYDTVLGFARERLRYAVTEISDFKTTPDTTSGMFDLLESGGVLRATLKPGTTGVVNDRGGFYVWGNDPIYRLRCTTFINHASFTAEFYSSASEAARTSLITSVTATGATDTTVNLAGAKGFVMLNKVDTQASPTRDDGFIKFYDLVRYYVDGQYDLGSSALVNDILTKCMPASLLTTAQQDRRFIIAESTVHQPFDPGMKSTAAEAIEQAIALLGYDFGFWLRKVGTGQGWRCLPHYQPVATIPSYQVVCADSDTEGSLLGSDIAEMYSAVDVTYTDPDGVQQITRRTNSKRDSYLAQIGIGKVGQITLNTTSKTKADAAGDYWLDVVEKVVRSGTIHVEGGHVLTYPGGVPVLPCEIEAGRIIRVQGLGEGLVDGRIIGVSKVGDYTADIQVDNTPDVAAMVYKKFRVSLG